MRFLPCAPCAAHDGKTGRSLCEPCQHNKTVIEALKKEIERRDEVTAKILVESNRIRELLEAQP